MIPQVRGFQGCYLDNHRNNWRCARAVRKRPLGNGCSLQTRTDGCGWLVQVLGDPKVGFMSMVCKVVHLKYKDNVVSGCLVVLTVAWIDGLLVCRSGVRGGRLLGGDP